MFKCIPALVRMHMNVNVVTRYQALIRSHQEEIAAIITREQGKTLADARGDVFRCMRTFHFRHVMLTTSYQRPGGC